MRALCVVVAASCLSVASAYSLCVPVCLSRGPQSLSTLRHLLPQFPRAARIRDNEGRKRLLLQEQSRSEPATALWRMSTGNEAGGDGRFADLGPAFLTTLDAEVASGKIRTVDISGRGDTAGEAAWLSTWSNFLSATGNSGCLWGCGGVCQRWVGRVCLWIIRCDGKCVVHFRS